jgi:methionine sulfoxide reductase catalytic subunit
MVVKTRRGWELPERAATPESVYLSRRDFMGAAAAGSLLMAAGPAFAAKDGPDPTLDLYPAALNARYPLDRPLTAQDVATSYNNFYEFGSHKSIVKAAQALPLRPWTITIDGMVERPQTLDFDSLIRKVALEERTYRLRCVEAWAMAVPWTGFAMAELVKLAEPKAGAKYLRFETFKKPEVASGQKQFWYPWPYVEGVTLAEASNELAFIATGLYGKPMPKQNGAPLRVVLPWKYGFKSIKSIVRVTFTDERPKTFWEVVQGSEYGFFANVNPAVPHARWSQAEERMIGTEERRPTQIYNGYGEFVASLYAGMDAKILFR